MRGRSFTTDDRAGAVDVAIVSDDVAARTWPGEEPIGKRLKMGGADSRSEWLTVVGVAASTRYKDLFAPSTLLGVALLLMLAAAFASYLPVRRATRIDAVVMLRSD